MLRLTPAPQLSARRRRSHMHADADSVRCDSAASLASRKIGEGAPSLGRCLGRQQRGPRMSLSRLGPPASWQIALLEVLRTCSFLAKKIALVWSAYRSSRSISSTCEEETGHGRIEDYAREGICWRYIPRFFSINVGVLLIQSIGLGCHDGKVSKTRGLILLVLCNTNSRAQRLNLMYCLKFALYSTWFAHSLTDMILYRGQIHSCIVSSMLGLKQIQPQEYHLNLGFNHWKDLRMLLSSGGLPGHLSDVWWVYMSRSRDTPSISSVLRNIWMCLLERYVCLQIMSRRWAQR